MLFRSPELVVLDPHKFIAGRTQLESGKKKYGDLFTLGFQAVRPGGVVAAFSCSGALELAEFLGLVF